MVWVSSMGCVFSVPILTFFGFLCFISCLKPWVAFYETQNHRHTEFPLCNSILNASSLFRIGNIWPVVFLRLWLRRMVLSFGRMMRRSMGRGHLGFSSRRGIVLDCLILIRIVNCDTGNFFCCLWLLFGFFSWLILIGLRVPLGFSFSSSATSWSNTNIYFKDDTR